MVTVFDVAQYILERLEQTTTIKLEKLVYYAQAWHLVWEDTPLFKSRIRSMGKRFSMPGTVRKT